MQQRRHRKCLIGGIALLSIIVGVGIIAIRWTSIGQTVGSQCTVGITDTSATVNVRGWTAKHVCSSLLSTNATYRFQNATPQGQIVCQYTIQGNLYTVRDEGVVKLIGGGICLSLRQQAPTQPTSTSGELSKSVLASTRTPDMDRTTL